MMGFTTRFGVASLAILFMDVDPCEGQWSTFWNLRHVTNRLLSTETFRHPSLTTEYDTIVENHPNAVSSRNSFFTSVYCAPDPNGYYGSTAGTPFEIRFAFEAETIPDAELENVVDSIRQSVETALLTTFFPTMCQKGTEPHESDVTGFHFDPNATVYAQPCEPLKDEENTCGVYVGSVRAYGEDGNALAIIRDHLDRDGTESIHPELRRLFSVTVDDGLVASGPGGSGSSGGESTGISAAAIAGISVALITLTIGLVGFVSMQLRRYRRKRSLNTGSRGSHSDSDDLGSIETIDLDRGTSVVIEGGRPRIFHEEIGNEVL